MARESLFVTVPHVELPGRWLPGEHAELRSDIAAVVRAYAAEGWVLVAAYPDLPGAQLHFKRRHAAVPSEPLACPICEEPSSVYRLASTACGGNYRATHRCRCCWALLRLSQPLSALSTGSRASR